MQHFGIRELIAEQRARASSGGVAEKLAAALLFPGVLRERLRQLSDFQFAQVLDHEVCSNFSVLAPELTICIEAVERLQRLREIKQPRRHSIRARHGEGEHILHAESALYWAGIPHLLLPFQRDKFASDTFMVPCAAEARSCLCQAGFRETHSPSLLIDRETRRPIRIVEHS